MEREWGISETWALLCHGGMPSCSVHRQNALLPLRAAVAEHCRGTLQDSEGIGGHWCSLLAWGLGFCFKSSLLVMLRCWQRVLSTSMNLVEDTTRYKLLPVF